MARLAQARVVATPAGDGGSIDRRCGDRAGAGRGTVPLSVRVAVNGPGRAMRRCRAPWSSSTAIARTCDSSCRTCERWWPAGYGEQPLYDVDVDWWRRRLGSAGRHAPRRRVPRRALGHRPPTTRARRSRCVVNDQPVFVKGVNWIPDDALPVRVTRDRLRRRFEQALDANLNLIRVWGGGLYESDDFYELADELGLLVVAGLPVRVRGVRRGGAAALRDRSRGAREHRAARPPRLAGAAHRQQREPVGLRGLGVEAAPGRQDLGRALLLRAVPGARRRARPARAVCPRQPVQPGCRLGRRGADRAAPQRRAARLDAPVGAVEPARLADLPRPPPAVRRRVRLAGTARVDHARPLRLATPR